MSLHDRAAQFAPFAALTGFDGVIAETGRQTECRAELSESETVLLDRKFARIIESLQQGQHPTVTVEYFEADALKDGLGTSCFSYPCPSTVEARTIRLGVAVWVWDCRLGFLMALKRNFPA